MTGTSEDAPPEDAPSPSTRPTVAGVARAAWRSWRYLYGETPLHLLSVLGCFALSGYVVSLLWDNPSLVALGVWFAGAVLGHDLLLYPLYALADQPLVAGRWLRRRALPQHPPLVPAINHVRVPFLGSLVLGLVWFPSITGRGAEAFEFTAGHPMVGQYENWLLITGALFTGSAVVYAVRLGAAGGRRLVDRLNGRRRGDDAEAPTDTPTGTPTEALTVAGPERAGSDEAAADRP